jgi:hypothetical protein
MNGATKEQLEAGRPEIDALEAISFTLEQLYEDGSAHYTQEVTQDLTFEELIGALLAARDEIDAARRDSAISS